MTDTDPPAEVDDVPAPHDRVHVAPDTDAGGNLVAQAKHQHAKRSESWDKEHPPPEWGFAFRQSTNPVRNPAEAAIVCNQRLALQLSGRLRDVCRYGWHYRRHDLCSPPGVAPCPSCSSKGFSPDCSSYSLRLRGHSSGF